MASKIKVDTLETADGTGSIALSNQLSGMTVASLPTTGTLPALSGANLTGLTSANLTGALPALDGSSLTNMAAGGKVLQVVGTMTAPNSFYSSTTSWVDTGYYIDITPSSTSSKILIQMDIQTNLQNSSAQLYYDMWRSVGGGTAASSSGKTQGFRWMYGSSAGDLWDSSTLSLLDSPSTTSVCRYMFYMKTNGNTCYIGFGNTTNVHNAGASFTAMELDYA